MIYGKLLNGRLTDIQHVAEPRLWTDGSIDVELVAMPGKQGPYIHDSVNRLAVQVKELTLQAALAIQASPATWASLTTDEKMKVQGIIKADAIKALAALRG